MEFQVHCKADRRVHALVRSPRSLAIVLLLLFSLHPGRFSCWFDGTYLNFGCSSSPRDSLYERVLVESEKEFHDLPDHPLCSTANNHTTRSEDPRVVVLIPYRDRRKHLFTLLKYFSTYFKVEERPAVLVVEQLGTQPFNRGKLFNIGYKESLALLAPDCLILHDVDLLPVGDVPYTCTQLPRHMSSSIDKFRYVLPYEGMTGGVLALSPAHFLSINGFSNKFEGWGGEDDHLYQRIVGSGLTVTRLPGERSRFRSLVHPPQDPSQDRFRILAERGRHRESGISNLDYRVQDIRTYDCYTHVLVHIS